MDAETIGLAQALWYPDVTLLKGAGAAAHCGCECADRRRGGKRDEPPEGISAPLVALCPGAVNTAALLLASAEETHPRGLANASDQGGRNFMNYNLSAVPGLSWRRNDSVYRKTIQANDFYLTGEPSGEPPGNVRLLGRISGTILAQNTPFPLPVARWIADHSVHLLAMSEDLPDPESRVMLKGGRIVLDWKRSSWEAHRALVSRLKAQMEQAGFPIVIPRAFDRRTPSHQCGTARMAQSPAHSVVDPYCRSHGHPNLFVVDASVLPTSAAVNPALAAAPARRTGKHIRERDWT